jgi:futalosine hydrolase
VSRILVVTAVEAERGAVLAGLGGAALGGAAGTVDVHAVGVGPAAAAAGTAWLLAREPGYSAVVSAGIGGGFADRIDPGGVALASSSIAADLGAESPDGYLPLDELGFGTVRYPCDPALLAALREALPGAVTGAVLTVSTVTGSAATARALLGRYPDSVAEGMEGFGVASAATRAGTGFVELRAISNPVGPRDRSAWRIPQALATLTSAAAALGKLGGWTA